MAEALKDQMGRADMDGLAFEERFSMLVDAQYLFRENKRMKRLLENAKLKLAASMEDIDYRSPRGLDKSVMLSLASCDWVRKHRNVIIVGPTGSGKPSLLRACPQGLQGGDDRLLPQNPEALLYPGHGTGGRELREGAREARQDVGPHP